VEDLKSTLNRLVKSLEGDVKGLESKVEALMKLPDRMEVESLPTTIAWAMDSGDMDLWLSVWSDDVRYVVPQYNIDIHGKEALKEFAAIAVFGLEARRFSAITNIVVDVKGDTASGKDYYMHYGYPINPETGEPSEERAVSEGQHFYEFAKLDGGWKITRVEVHLNRRQEGVQ
jgi:ketosteroid isomerase-like protein